MLSQMHVVCVAVVKDWSIGVAFLVESSRLFLSLIAEGKNDISNEHNLMKGIYLIENINDTIPTELMSLNPWNTLNLHYGRNQKIHCEANETKLP